MKQQGLLKTDRKAEGRHDWSGSCVPGSQYPGETFSVGIFQWVKNASGGLKKTSVKIRVRGYTSSPDDVYRLADKFCDMLDAGKDPGVKSVYASDLKWLEFGKGE